jgi:glyoxylase-like metal-dependent hydrolase (beta-lactamase superfamily II)
VASRQEQEPARSQVTEVAPGVARMELPIHMPGLGHVNCYALLDKDGAAVMDPGLPGPGTWRAIQERLGQIGLKTKDVHTVLISHSHPDHFGCAARFAKESGAKVVAYHSFQFGPYTAPATPEVSVEDLTAHHVHAHGLHETDTAELSETLGSELHESRAVLRRAQKAGRTPWGGKRPMPPFLMRMKWRALRFIGRSFIPVISHPVEHGDVLQLCGREWFVTHTPGHTSDHFCLHDPAEGVMLSGDHVLPTITPHISGIGSSPDPLASFFYSLDRVGETAHVRQVLPAHGHPFDDLPARTQAIKRHHFERLERVKEISREFGRFATVQEFSQLLFKPRSWGAMAESETYAHLEHLRVARNAERREDAEGRFVYLAG